MSADLLFSISNGLALIGWLILIFLPRRWGAFPIPTRYVIPGLLGISYAIAIIPALAGASGSFTSLEGLRSLYETANDDLLVAGWQHYLAFDLFVGTWIAERLDRLGVNRLIQIPAYLLTFIAGPVGLLICFAIEAFVIVRRRSVQTS